MSDQGDLFAPRSRQTAPTGRQAPARASDPETSQQAAAMPFQRDSQRHRLLAEYKRYPEGLTDEEAATMAGITKGCPWKRCSELREVVMIAPVVTPKGILTRPSSMGASQQVHQITGKGRLVLEQMEQDPSERSRT